MNAIEILRDIIADGYLSDTNNARAQQLIARIDTVRPEAEALLAECREQYLRGEKVDSVRRFRAATGCGLREALDTVSQGA